MCGIWALFGIDVHSISKYDKTFSKIQHRGPDAWRLEYDLKVKVITVKKNFLFKYITENNFLECLSWIPSSCNYRQPLRNATDEIAQISIDYNDLQWGNF